jgi:hypothetical protein
MRRLAAQYDLFVLSSFIKHTLTFTIYKFKDDRLKS